MSQSLVGAVQPERRLEKSYNAAMANAVEIGSLIDRDSRIRGGRPKIAGTGVTVLRVAGWYKLGLSPLKKLPPNMAI
jgi:hypothetical protein